MEKKLLVLLIALLSQLCGWADVYTDPTTNIVYTYVKGSGEASIESTTNTESSGSTSEPTPTPTPTPTPVDGGVKTTQVVSGDISVLEKFTVDDEMYVVTKIGKNAFCGCSDLTSVTLPASIASGARESVRNMTKANRLMAKRLWTELLTLKSKL